MTVDDRRRHERMDLLAQVQVTRDSTVEIMTTLNLSLGGAFLQGEAAAGTEFSVGTRIELQIFAPDDEGADISCRAEVVRVERGEEFGPPAGIGVKFLGLGKLSRARLAKLLETASDPSGPPPPPPRRSRRS